MSSQPGRATAMKESVICVREGCGGVVVRHSLGCGQAVSRCMRCFTKYDPVVGGQRTFAPVSAPTLSRRVVGAWREFLSWRDA
jgi:hypothetical protein